MRLASEIITVAETLLVRVVDDTGREGWGEASVAPTMTGDLLPGMVAALVRFIGPAVCAAPVAGPEEARLRIARAIRGNSGAKAAAEIAMLDLFARAGGVPLTHVPYRGAALALNDVVAGTLALSVNTLGGGLPLHQAGRVRMLAVASGRRPAAAPEVPTLEEAFGARGFRAVLWNAIFAPPALPAPVLARLAEASNVALRDSAFRAALDDSGIEPAEPGTPETASAFLAEEIARYRPVVESVRAELDG
jgi:tripartite-type tricarboxylate transporter receptor subunit TctC